MTDTEKEEMTRTLANDNEMTNAERETITRQEDSDEKPSKLRAIGSCFLQFYTKNSFLILILIVILLAYVYPPLGAIYLAPQITATWIAVIFIFLLSGIKLKSEELGKASKSIYFNAFVQCYNFGVVSAVVYGVSRLLLLANILNEALANGMVISASVPITVNMVLVLTQSANGDEAAAVFNAAFGNAVGVFLSPALILLYLGVIGSVDLATVFYKLLLRVIVPIIIGQILRKFSPTVVNFVKEHKKMLNKAQEYCLIFIVYTVFCKTFTEESETSAGAVFIMIGFIFLILASLMAIAWYLLKLLFNNKPKLRVMGLYGCTHKSVAVGIPLIHAIYEGSPLVGFYTLPLLVWHPMQLVVGTFLAPQLSAFVKREEKRLGLEEEDDNNDGENVDNDEHKNTIEEIKV